MSGRSTKAAKGSPSQYRNDPSIRSARRSYPPRCASSWQLFPRTARTDQKDRTPGQSWAELRHGCGSASRARSARGHQCLNTWSCSRTHPYPRFDSIRPLRRRPFWVGDSTTPHFGLGTSQEGLDIWRFKTDSKWNAFRQCGRDSPGARLLTRDARICCTATF